MPLTLFKKYYQVATSYTMWIFRVEHYFDCIKTLEKKNFTRPGTGMEYQIAFEKLNNMLLQVGIFVGCKPYP